MSTPPKIKIPEQLRLELRSVDGGSTESSSKERVYRLTGDEILRSDLDPATWARALAEAGPSRDEALSRYAKLRTEELSGAHAWSEAKREALEARRLASGKCQENIRLVWKRKLSLFWDFFYWQGLLSIAGLGAFFLIVAMKNPVRWWPGVVAALVVSLLLQLSPVILFSIGRLFSNRLTYLRSLFATTVAIVLASSLFGSRILFHDVLPRWARADLPGQHAQVMYPVHQKVILSDY